MKKITKSAGYSGTPLPKKLGIKENSDIVFINPPSNYKKTLGNLPEGVKTNARLSGKLDLIQFFTKEISELVSKSPDFKRYLNPSGILWISWPKNSSGVLTDLDENKIRETGLKNGMVDIKVCAIDEIWSGLKFVFRLKDR
jgi:hypothetical protein